MTSCLCVAMLLMGNLHLYLNNGKTNVARGHIVTLLPHVALHAGHHLYNVSLISNALHDMPNHLISAGKYKYIKAIFNIVMRGMWEEFQIPYLHARRTYIRILAILYLEPVQIKKYSYFI